MTTLSRKTNVDPLDGFYLIPFQGAMKARWVRRHEDRKSSGEVLLRQDFAAKKYHIKPGSRRFFGSRAFRRAAEKDLPAA